MKKVVTFIILSLITYHLCLILVLAQSQDLEASLTWSTNTYLPIGYSGKALPIKDSSVEVVANIDKKTISIANLDFLWFLDREVKRYASGLGKDSFEFVVTKPSGDEHEITLEIRNSNGTLLLRKYLSILISAPQIVVYQTNPHLQALTNQSQIKSNQKLEITALPYFFNIGNLKELDYDWSFAGEKAEKISSKNPNLFSLAIGQVDKNITEELKLNVVNAFNPRERDSLDLEIIIKP